MQLHLDDKRTDQPVCLAAIIAIMLLTGSAILYMGASYHVAAHVIARQPLAAPL